MQTLVCSEQICNIPEESPAKDDVLCVTIQDKNSILFRCTHSHKTMYFLYSVYPSVLNSLIEAQAKQFSVTIGSTAGKCPACSGPIAEDGGLSGVSVLNRSVACNTPGQFAADILLALSCGCVVLARFLFDYQTPSSDATVNSKVALHSVLWIPLKVFSTAVTTEGKVETDTPVREAVPTIAVYQCTTTQVIHCLLAVTSVSLMYFQLRPCTTSLLLSEIHTCYTMVGVSDCPLRLYQYLFPAERYLGTKKVAITGCVPIPSETTKSEHSSDFRISTLILHQYQTDPREFPVDVVSTGVITVQLAESAREKRKILRTSTFGTGNSFVQFSSAQKELDLVCFPNSPVLEGSFSLRGVNLAHPCFLYYHTSPHHEALRTGTKNTRREYGHYLRHCLLDGDHDLVGVFTRPSGKMFLPSAYLRSNGFGASGSTSHTYCDTADSLEEEYSFTLFNGDGEVAKVVVGGYVESAVQLHMRAAPSDVVGAILLMVSPQVRGGAAPQLALLEIGCEVKGSKEMEKRSYTLRLRKLSSTTLEGARYLHFVDGTYHPSHVELLFSAAATGESFLTSAIHSVTVLLAGQEETAGPIGPLTSLAPPTTYTTRRELGWWGSPQPKQLDYVVCEATSGNGRRYSLLGSGAVMHRANGSDHSALQLLSTLPPVSSGETLVSYALELLFTSAHDEIVCFACDQSELITDAALEEYTNHFQASPEREVCYLVCCVRDVAVVVHTATGQVLHAVKLTEGEGSHLCLVRRRDAEGGESPSVKHALGDTKGVLLLLSGFEFYPADTSRTGERGVPDRQVRPFVAVLQLTFQLFKLPRTSLETLHEPPAPYVRLTLQDMAWLDFHLRDSTPPLSESSLKERQSALYIFEQMVPTVSVEAGAVAEGGEVGVVVQTPHHKWKGALHISYEPDDAHPSYCPLCHVSLKVEG